MSIFRKNIENAINRADEAMNTEERLYYQDAMEIIAGSDSRMDAVDNAYMFGYAASMRRADLDRRMVPVLNIPQMTDERWNELATKQKCRLMSKKCG